MCVASMHYGAIAARVMDRAATSCSARPIGNADAMYAPVVARFHNYGLPVSTAAHAYMDAVMATPAWREWYDAAMQGDLDHAKQRAGMAAGARRCRFAIGNIAARIRRYANNVGARSKFRQDCERYEILITALRRVFNIGGGNDLRSG